MMTFKEMRTRNHYLYPETIPADLRLVINNWFDYREVCDDDKFVTFFQRLLERDYKTYKELLRIEPGIAQYDWLVQQYREHERKLKENEQKSNNGSNVRTLNGHIVTNGTVTDIYEDTENGNSQKSGSHVDNANETNTTFRTGNYRDNGITNIDDTTNNSGSNEADVENHSGDKALNKNAPMSVQYAQTDINTSGDNHDGEPNRLSWNTLTAQAQSSHDGTEHAKNQSEDESHRIARNTQDNSGTNSLSGSDTKAKNGNGLYTDNMNDSRNRSHNGERENNSDVVNETTDEMINNARGESNKYGLDRSIDSGRSIDIATLLTQSANFIKKSEAWEWLYSRLDTCFIGIY